MNKDRHYQIWVLWKNTGLWEMLKTFDNISYARKFFKNNISISGKKILRVELRERPGKTPGEVLYDSSWEK